MSVRTLCRTHATRLARWGLLCLEDRVTPAINVWTGNAGTTNWADDNNWSEFRRPTSDDDAYINTAVTVTHGGGTDTVKSLNLGGNAILQLSGGSLAVTNLVEAPAASSDLVLSGGFLVGGTVTAGSEVIGTSSGGVLSGVTLAGTLNLAGTTNVQAGVLGGLTLSGGTILLGSSAGSYGYLGFGGTQTLGGSGTVVFGTNSFNILQAGPTAGSHLTIGPNVTVRGHSGAVGYTPVWGGSTDVTMTNQGTIRADSAGGTISVGGQNWTNTGTIAAASGTLTLLGSWANSGTLKSAGDTAAIAPSPTGATQIGNVVTITTTAAHGFAVGQSVRIAGVGGGYDGTFAIASVPTTTTFTYTHFSTGLAPAGGGTATLNSTLNLGGSFATPTLGTVTSTGGAVNLTGTLNNVGNTLTLNAGTGSWNLLGGTIAGGTVATSGGSRLVATSSGGALSGVTLTGTFDLTVISGAYARVTGGLTLNGGTVLIGNSSSIYGVLSFDGGSQTLGGTGEVVFGGNIYNFLQAGPTAGSHLTIGPNVIVRGHTGGIGYHPGWGGVTDVTFTNQGIIQSGLAGGNIILGGHNWTNIGTIAASGGGSLELRSPAGSWTSTTPLTIDGGGTLALGGDHWTTAGITFNGSTVNLGGTFTLADLGTFNRTGGTVNITGTLDNTNQTLVLDAVTGPWRLLGGTISGGRVTTSGSNTLIGTTSAGILNGVTLAGTLDLSVVSPAYVRVTGGLTLDGGTILIGNDAFNYGLLQFDGGTQTLGGTGEVVFGNYVYNFLQAGPTAGSSLTIGPDVLVHGRTGGIGFSPYWGGPANVSVTNLGTIQADVPGGEIHVGNAANVFGGTLTGGTWKAVNSTLGLLGASITTNAATIVLDGPNSRIVSDLAGTIDSLGGLSANAAGGTFTVQNGRSFTGSGQFANAGTLTVGPGGTFGVTHPFASSVIAFSTEYSLSPGAWSAFQATGPSNTPGYGDYPTAWTSSSANPGPAFLTLGFANPDFADGVIIRETLGNGFVTQVEAIDTDNNTHVVWTGTDPSQPGTAVNFLASWPRTAYRVKAVTIRIDTLLNSSYEEIDSVQLVGASTGYTQTGGRTTVVAGGSLAMPAGSTFVQTGGTTTVDGTLSATTAVDVQGGLLEGTGTVAASVVNAGTVNSGPGTGTLTITGDYTQTAAGTLAVELGGLTQYDRLNVGGSATLAGALAVDLVNGYFPTVGSGFTPLDLTGAGTAGGTAFAGLGEGATFDEAGPTTFKITYAGGSGNDVGLTAINRAPTLDPIPDPPSTLENPGLQTVNLTGIGSGNVESQGLTITAVSDNPSLIPHPTVSYTSPNATGSLSYTPVDNRDGTATITVTVTDTGGTANGGVNTITQTFIVTVVEVNDAPTLDVIPDPNAIPEDAAQQTINLTGISAGGGETQTLTVTATSNNPSLIPNPTVTYTSADPTGTLTYTPVANQHGTATITVTVKDDGGTAFGGIDDVVRLFTVTVLPVPDAPTIDTDPLTMLTPVPTRLKPTVEPTGTLVSDLLTNPTDVDGDPVGIAVTGLDPANTVNTRGVPKFGVWQFSTDGTTWNPIPRDVSPTAALVLSADATTRVRFLPNLRFQGLSHLTFRAWDHSDTAIPGSRVDPTLAPTAYGADPERAWVAVGKSKPPVTADGATLLTTVREDARWSRVFPVKSVLGLAGLEALPATGLGLAITGQSSATGTWRYRLAGTKEFLPIDPVSPANALLLRPTDQLRFIPVANANGTGGLTFKTWVPDANFGTYADASGFGVGSGAAVIPIKAVNDAPVVDPALRPDLGTLPAGGTSTELTVTALLAMAPGVATDVDTAALGILLFPASARVGKWQYFDGAAWKDVTAAKKLGANVLVRFQAAAGATAGTYTLGFKLWDGKLLSKLTGAVTVTIG